MMLTDPQQAHAPYECAPFMSYLLLLWGLPRQQEVKKNIFNTLIHLISIKLVYMVSIKCIHMINNI